MAVKTEEIFREDGSLFGVHFGKASGNRGPALTVNLKRGDSKVATAFTLDRCDFYTQHARAAEKLAEFHGIGKKSKVLADMKEKAVADAFLKANGLKLEKISFNQVA